MKVVSVIPSKGRPDRLSSNTLSWLCLSKHDWFVFVEPQDYEAYKKVVPHSRGFNRLIKIDANDQGLGYVKTWIAAWLKKQDYDLAFKLDDDILTWHDRGSRKTPEACAEVFDRAIADSIEMFEKYDHLAAVSFPYRNELYELIKWPSINSRLQTAYIVRPEYFVGHPNVSTFEDFYNYIYIRSKNMTILRYGLIGIDNDVGKAEGGLQSPSLNRREMAEAEVPLLRKLYPALQFKKVEGKSWHIEPVLQGEFFGQKRI